MPTFSSSTVGVIRTYLGGGATATHRLVRKKGYVIHVYGIRDTATALREVEAAA